MIRSTVANQQIFIYKVKFVGEAAVDTGGPGREFWHLLNRGIAAEYCRGKDGKLVFERNTEALQVNII